MPVLTINASSRRLSRPMSHLRDSVQYQLAESISASILAQKEILIESLANRYQFRDYTQVTAFLRDHPFLIALLLEAHPKIKTHFSLDTEIALEVFHDPEGEDRKLFALVLTPLSADEALTLRDRLDEEWWLDASERAHGQLIIDVEYI